MLREEKAKVLKAHLGLRGHLKGEDIEVVADRDRETSYVLNSVVMERPEEQASSPTERRAKLQNV
jgi:hypothetical protein